MQFSQTAAKATEEYEVDMKDQSKNGTFLILEITELNVGGMKHSGAVIFLDADAESIADSKYRLDYDVQDKTKRSLVFVCPASLPVFTKKCFVAAYKAGAHAYGGQIMQAVNFHKNRSRDETKRVRLTFQDPLKTDFAVEPIVTKVQLAPGVFKYLLSWTVVFHDDNPDIYQAGVDSKDSLAAQMGDLHFYPDDDGDIDDGTE